MEEKRGIFTYFTGIARLILFIILLAIITFFVVRWIRARQDTKVAQRAAQGQTNQGAQKDSNTETKTDKKSDTNESPVGSQSENGTNKSTTGQGAPAVEVPGGVADSNASPSGNQKVPNAGMESSLAVTAVMISLCVYSLIRFTQSRAIVAEYQ